MLDASAVDGWFASIEDVAAARASGLYRVVTPEESVELMNELAAQGLGRYKAPEQLMVVHQIPRNAMGKLLVRHRSYDESQFSTALFGVK
ncbi:hypothetical protein [Mycobacterium paraintracellulare]|uniref:hypothetical protein n=1 Tax=Mycobacterium paraintracellulare TaxID=1138383 RepID=UPI0019271622|nr:hypothetical protein [Mycobacterium paraintracellulare]BCP05406.1 hypothetical protein MINTM019_28620 [Mycobacterium paraintracellulare]